MTDQFRGRFKQPSTTHAQLALIGFCLYTRAGYGGERELLGKLGLTAGEIVNEPFELHHRGSRTLQVRLRQAALRHGVQRLPQKAGIIRT